MFWLFILMIFATSVCAEDIKISPTVYRHTETKQEIVEIDVQDVKEQMDALKKVFNEHTKARGINIYEREEYWDTILDQDKENIDVLQKQIDVGEKIGVTLK